MDFEEMRKLQDEKAKNASLEETGMMAPAREITVLELSLRHVSWELYSKEFISEEALLDLRQQIENELDVRLLAVQLYAEEIGEESESN